MQRLLLITILTLSAASANAETYKELSVSGQVGVGGDSSADTTQSAQALAEAKIGAGVFLPEIGLNPFGENIYFLRKPLLGITAEGAAAATLQSCDGCSTAEGALTAAATLHALWVDGSAGFTYQAPVSMNQKFWRPTNGLEERSFGFHFPGIMNIDAVEDDFAVHLKLGGFETTRTEVLQHNGSNTEHLGDDYSWYIYGFAVDVDLIKESFRVRGITYEIKYWVSPHPNTDARDEPIAFVRDYRDGADRVSSMDLTLLDFGRSAEGIGVTRAAFGVNFLTPLNPGVKDFNDIGYTWVFGVGADSFDLQRTLWSGDGIVKPRYGALGWNVEIGSFQRISPSGLAADRGQKLRGDLGWKISDSLNTSVTATAIRAQRTLVYEPWAHFLDDFGDSLPMIMGRLEVNGVWQINELANLSASSWVENSDRPVNNSQSGTTLDTGVNLALGFSY